MRFFLVMLGVLAVCRSLPTRFFSSSRPTVTAIRMASSAKMVSKHVLVAIADGNRLFLNPDSTSLTLVAIATLFVSYSFLIKACDCGW